jgi:hypothetical protein
MSVSQMRNDSLELMPTDSKKSGVLLSIKESEVKAENANAISKEMANVKELAEGPDLPYLYPNLDDPLFNIKIAERKEFNDTQYDGQIKNVEDEAERLCNADFELAPHQLFVRNFLSFTTPYNSLLLYHGLGSGKTCSAIGVGEEMRAYLKQMGINQRIIVVASPNVQENFKLQLFDERKLKLVDGLWNIKACTGNSLLKEINPMSMRGLSKDKIVRQVKRIINNSYLFLGYIEFANYISKIADVTDIEGADKKEVRNRRLRRYFNNRLVIIDEVHNIRITDENKDKKVAVELMKMVEVVSGLRLLLLSATPMYNSYKEIVWLVNLMNINDRRPPVQAKEIFDKNGNFLVGPDGEEIGKELLERKSTGYISFVRGENPYGFPYRIYPSLFDTDNAIESQDYPDIQLNGKRIIQGVSHLGLYSVNIGEYQKKGYQFIMDTIRTSVREGKPPYREMPNFDNMESFGYTMLQRPLEALNIVYPDSNLDKALAGEKTDLEPKNIVGKGGLTRIFKYKEVGGLKKDFEYRLKKYKGIMGPAQIGLYSSKIESIIKNALSSEGIILVYSQYIDGGLIPIALALEEIGYTRYVPKGGKSRSLFGKAPTQPIDAITFEPKETYTGSGSFKPARYAMITGDKSISPNNIDEIKALTNESNVNGEQIKVVLISQAGSEGLDFTAIRQVHVLEPWYNMNRIEQIIGRAVRWCSHKALPFTKRNVEIFLYCTRLGEEEAADLYVYRLAEVKAIQIGRVSRVLKESAVDCLLNGGQNNFTTSKLNQTVKQILSSGKTIDYPVGDRPYTATCDYMETCQLTCKPEALINADDVKLDTFSEAFIMMNTDKIIQRLRQLFREKFFYNKRELITLINNIRQYPLVQIDAALTQLIEDKNEFITDMYGRLGNLINKGELYLFQPLELQDEDVSVFDRMVPIQYKNDVVQIPPMSKEVKADEKEIVQEEDTSLFERIEKDYVSTLVVKEPERGEDNWYVFASNVIEDMVKEGYADKSTMMSLIIAHIIEMLNYQSLSNVLKMLFENYELVKKIAPNSGPLIREYIESKFIREKGITALPVYKNNFSLLILGKDGKFKDAEAEDYSDLSGAIQQLKSKTSSLANIVGFVASFKNDYMVFKTKQMSKKRHKGARCDQSGKSEALRVLNLILDDFGREEYTAENTKSMSQKSVCVRQELILRVFNKENKNGKVWFMTSPEAALVELEKL